MTLIDIFKRSIDSYPDKKAFTMKMGYRTVELTYKELADLTYKTAVFLQEHGIQQGDKIAICALNSPYWVTLFWACQLIGAIPVPLNIQMPIAQIQKILVQADVNMLFVSPLFKYQLPNIQLFILDHLDDLVQHCNGTHIKEATIQPDDLVEILYTSGTTGDPKGVMLTQQNITSNLESVSKLINVNLENDRLLSILPLSHIFEQMAGFLLPFSRGVHVVYAHSHGAIAELMKEYNITKMGAVPEFLQIFMTRIEDAVQANRFKRWLFYTSMHLSKLVNNNSFSRFIFYPFLKKIGGKLDTIACGGAFLDPALEQKWQNMGIYVLQGYGLTETSPTVTTNTYDIHRFASVGKAIEHVDVKIAPDKEILVKGPNVFKGYYKNPEKTAESFTQDGYFKTGDMGEFDSDGFLFIKGRKKYMILSAGGQNVYPEDIETELNKLEGIKESCVVGIAKDHTVEIHAVLLLADKKIDIEKAVQEANSHLATYQRINAYSVWPEMDFPRTVTRKVKKNAIIEWIQSNQQELGDYAQQKDRLITILAQIAGINPNKITLQSNLVKNLQLDSLMRVELVVWIEQDFDVEIQESDITPDTTVEQLDQLIKQQKAVVYKKPTLKKWPRTKIVGMLRLFVQPIVFLLFKPFVKLNIKGLEHLENLPYPVIFMPTHATYLDGVIFTMALPRKIRNKLAFAAARDVLYDTYPITSRIADFLFNTFPIQRGNYKDIKIGLEFIGKVLDQGFSVVLFPEGQMSKTGELQALKSGAGLIAVEMDASVVPVSIKGLQKIFPYNAMWPRSSGIVTVEFLKPLTFTKSTAYVDAEKAIEQEFKK